MQILIQYALQFVGLPYKWGGDDPILGFDCSGFVQELLAAVGLDPAGDQTAQALYDIFKSKAGSAMVQDEGSLLFFGKSVKEITHVAFAITPLLMIEAGGGGSKTNSAQDAAAQNAYLRIRPISRRSDLVASIRPFYPMFDKQTGQNGLM